MAKQRAVRDYNESGRVVRTAKWWFAPEEVSQKSRKRWKFYLLAVGVAAAAALVVSFIHPVSTPNAVPVAAPPTVVPTLVPPAAVSSCSAADPVEVPPETLVLSTFDPVWVRDGTMSRPTSTTGGPFQGDPFPKCFARTPEGALYATASFATGVISATDNGSVQEFFEARASHTGNYTVLMDTLPTAGTVTDAPQLSISGYRWNSYSPDSVSLEIRYSLMTGINSGQQVAITYNLVWENNDWLQVVPGKSDTVTVTVDGKRTYIPWGTT